MNFSETIYTYRQFRDGIKLSSDPYCIGNCCIQKPLVKTLLSNPYLHDYDNTMIVLELMNNEIHGRIIFFPSRLKKGNIIIDSTGASSLFVSVPARKYMLGTNLVMYPLLNKQNDILLYGAMTDKAVALYKKLKFTIFDVPTVWQIRNFSPILARMGLKGLLLRIVSLIANLFLKVYILLVNTIIKNDTIKYEVKPLNDIPDWIVDSIMNDRHKYSEYHGKEWFQWVLENNFFDYSKNSKKLYGIYSDNQPCGFFLLSEQESDLSSTGAGNVVFGYMLEWGIVNEKIFNEEQLYRIANIHFSENVDVVSLSSLNHNVLIRLKKYGFIRHGNTNIAFKDLGNVLDEDSKDIHNWRIRACSDSPFS